MAVKDHGLEVLKKAAEEVTPGSLADYYLKVKDIGGGGGGGSSVPSASGIARHDYLATPVTTSAYQTIVGATADEITSISIFDSSGQTLVLAFGAIGSELDKIFIPPGGTGLVDLRIPVGTRLSVKAVSATANSGEINLSLFKSGPTGKNPIDKTRNDYTGTPANTGVYTELLAATSDAVEELFIFDSSGQSLILAVGPSGFEVDKIYIPPGGNGLFPLQIPSGTRISVRAISGNATTGEINISFLGSGTAGISSVALARNDYTGTPVTTGAYQQLVAALPDQVNKLFIFDSSGQTLVLATGPAGFEVDKIYIPPGGNGLIDLMIPSGLRVAIKAISGNATTGEINVSFLK